ncbi:MAG TPA: 50S ribosomal protein L3 [Candidatus Nanoarchaeia archaeon]|nr:50S ribosomal protein L3 [Candidatus Nanoarchaeia archaeon]
MSQPNMPRRGSLQYWPRKRSRHSLVRVRSWVSTAGVKPSAFIGYKAGMTQLLIDDNHPKSMTKGTQVIFPATIVDCPPLAVCGVAFYKFNKTMTSVLAPKLAKELGKKIQLPKKTSASLADIKDFDDLRLLVHSQPKLTPSGTKKPKLLELAIGGSKDQKFKYAQDMLGKELSASDVLGDVHLLDVKAVTKGKGFQGTVKRFGVPIRQHKAEKTKRGIGNLGSWTPKRVQFTVAQSGKMGYHQRTEFNKELLKIGTNGEEVTPQGGIIKYGEVKNQYLLIKGSIPGPKKKAVVLTPAIRPNKHMMKGVYTVKSVLQ